MDKIVIIEDDPGIRTVLRLALKGAGFADVLTEERGDSGLTAVLRERPALVVLDLMLPGTNGLAVCREIRRTPSVAATPIVMLTAKSAEEDIVRGLELGADDYVTKPFSKAVLIARIRAALRRPASAHGPSVSVSGLVLDETTRSATVGSAPLVLTRSEFDLLRILVSHPSRVYTRPQILDAIQSEDKDVTDRTVDTLMVGLRRKLGEWAVTEAKVYARHGLLAAIAIDALVVLAIIFFVRRYEQRLSRLSAERALQEKLLAEMRKLETFRQDFITNVSHEIKTPVTGILGAVEILADGSNALDEQDRSELQKVLKDQSVRLNALVEDILALARLEKAEADKMTNFTPCNLADVVQTAVNLARPQAIPTGIDLVFFTKHQTPSTLTRPCDPRLVESAVSNLIQNAIRYSGSKTIEVGIESTSSGKALIRVTDRGVGIPKECQSRLFERFYRVDKNRSRAAANRATVPHLPSQPSSAL